MDTIQHPFVWEAIDDVFRKSLREQIRRSRAHRIEQGLWPGLAPLGYTNARRHGEPRIEVDPVAAPLVKQAFYLAAAGKYPVQTMRDMMTERGLLSRRGTPLAVLAWWKLLTNPFYIGQMRLNGTLHPGRHEPLIDKHTFEQVQRKLAKGQKR